MMSPMQQIQKLYIDNLEKFFDIQLNNVTDYTAICMNQLRTVSEISDQKSLDDFIIKQGEAYMQISERVLTDTRAYTNLHQEFAQEAKEITETQIEKVSETAKNNIRNATPPKAA
jgi:phasin family protein